MKRTDLFDGLDDLGTDVVAGEKSGTNGIHGGGQAAIEARENPSR